MMAPPHGPQSAGEFLREMRFQMGQGREVAGSVLLICGLRGTVPQGTGTASRGSWTSVYGSGGALFKGQGGLQDHKTPGDLQNDSLERCLPTPTPFLCLELHCDSDLGPSHPLPFLLWAVAGVDPVRH